MEILLELTMPCLGSILNLKLAACEALLWPKEKEGCFYEHELVFAFQPTEAVVPWPTSTLIHCVIVYQNQVQFPYDDKLDLSVLIRSGNLSMSSF